MNLERALRLREKIFYVPGSRINIKHRCVALLYGLLLIER